MKEWTPPSPSLLLSVTLVVVSLVVGPGVSGARGKKGEPCSRDPDCDQSSLIGCDRVTRTCDCPAQFNFFYSAAEGKCVSYVDGICTYTKSPPLPSIDCVQNAICLKSRDPQEINGKCVCKTGHYRTKDSQCAKDPPIGGGGGIETPRGGRNGIETPRTKSGGGASSSPSTRYPEPWHSMSTAPPNQLSTFSTFTFLLILLFHHHILDHPL